MARSSVLRQTVVRQKYYWPDAQLNFWTIIILVSGATLLGIFASFVVIQERLGRDIPWIFPYGITVGALTLIAVLIEFSLIAQRRLLPGVMMLLSVILFVLYLAGLIETAIQLFGDGNVNNVCQNQVQNMRIIGDNYYTLAWIENSSICSCWYAVFSFWIIGDVFFIWMMIMASQVMQDVFY